MSFKGKFCQRWKLIRTGMLCSILFKSLPCMGAASIELLPIAVWQGKPSRPWSVTILQDIRRAHSRTPMAHAVNASSMARGGAFESGFRDGIAQCLQTGDDVILHFAPWKSLVESSGVTFKYEPTVFGAVISTDDCQADCGLELSVRAFEPKDVEKINRKSLSLLEDSGFGIAKAVYFDEGVVPNDYRDSAKSSGLKYDWSGIENNQLMGSLGRFPVAQWNREQSWGYSLTKTDIEYERGLHLDHVRFSIHAEIGEIESSKKLITDAIEVAKKENRNVRIPMIFNVEDLIHTREFVEESIQLINKMSLEAMVPIKDFEATNTSWDVNKIRVNKPIALVSVESNMQVIASDSSQVVDVAPTQEEYTETIALLPGEAVFVPDNETPAIMNTAH